MHASFGNSAVPSMSFAFVLVLGASLLLGGCASVSGRQSNPDPLEPFNRVAYRFNSALDSAFMIPIAKGYKHVVPRPMREGVGNFFSNLKSPIVIVNDLLQGKFLQGTNDTLRLGVNTTLGVLGLFNPASRMGLPKHDEDFGQTLGYWGIGPGPYLVLPLLGPSDFRDAAGMAVDYQLDPLSLWQQTPEKYELRALDLVDTRARYLPATEMIEQSVNPYVFMRESYLQHRRYLIHGGSASGGEGLELPPPSPPISPSGEKGTRSSAPAGARSENSHAGKTSDSQKDQ